jgi:rsbT co-antagonist protein RsbR
LDYAYSELENALTTLQNLLHVAKPDLENEPFDSIDVSAELEALLYLFQEKSYHISVIKQFSDTDVRVYGKRNQLKKAFFNLIKNAFEAIPEKGTIVIKHFEANHELIVLISDTGVGIPREKVSLLGTPFYTSKAEGTGMGLTQVYSSIYEHGGKIHVKSEVGVGTQFSIQLPIQKMSRQGVVRLNLNYIEDQSFAQFYTSNQDAFYELLRSKGEEIFKPIQDSEFADLEFILESARKVVLMLNEKNEHGLIMHAKDHGRNWARNNLDLILKLEWIQHLRKLYWGLLYNYYKNVELNQLEFFELERQVNFNLDTYLKHFAASYSTYKNEILQTQQEAIEDLSVPVIPLSDKIAILPIVGTLDTHRAKKIQDHVLSKVYELKIKQIIIDLSSVSYMDEAIVAHLFKLVNGVAIQGCKAIITGIRPQITHTMVELGIALHEKVLTMGTLQQAIEECEKELKRV